MIRLYISIFFVLHFVWSFAQNTEGRFEYPLTGKNGVGDLFVLDTTLVLTVFDNFAKREHQPDRKYVVLNQELDVIAQFQPTIDFRQKKVGSYRSISSLYHLFYDYRLGDFTLVEVRSDGELVVQNGLLPSRIYEPKFIVNGSDLFVVNHQPKQEEVIVLSLIDSSVRTMDVSPTLKLSTVKDLGFEFLPKSEEVFYCWQEQSRNKVITQFVIWDNEADVDMRYIRSNQEQQFMDIGIAQTEDGDHIISGSYGKPLTDKSSGVFFGTVQDGSLTQISYTPFTKLTHFFDYMSSYKKDEFERKIKRLKRHEKSTDVAVYAFQHPIHYCDSSFFLALEMYTMSYTDQYGVTRNGSTIAGSPRKFNGYIYSHAVVIRFNEFGDLMHDYYVPLRLGFTPPVLKGNLCIETDQDTLLIAYSAKNRTYLGKIRPRSFLQMSNDSLLFPGKREAVIALQAQFNFWGFDTSNKCHYISHGFETRLVKDGLKRKENIYFIEKGKLR